MIPQTLASISHKDKPGYSCLFVLKLEKMHSSNQLLLSHLLERR